jgi:hypothetical protein
MARPVGRSAGLGCCREYPIIRSSPFHFLAISSRQSPLSSWHCPLTVPATLSLLWGCPPLCPYPSLPGPGGIGGEDDSPFRLTPRGTSCRKHVGTREYWYGTNWLEELRFFNPVLPCPLHCKDSKEHWQLLPLGPSGSTREPEGASPAQRKLFSSTSKPRSTLNNTFLTLVTCRIHHHVSWPVDADSQMTTLLQNKSCQIYLKYPVLN